MSPFGQDVIQYGMTSIPSEGAVSIFASTQKAGRLASRIGMGCAFLLCVMLNTDGKRGWQKSTIV
jgi:hypothetical protein